MKQVQNFADYLIDSFLISCKYHFSSHSRTTDTSYSKGFSQEDPATYSCTFSTTCCCSGGNYSAPLFAEESLSYTRPPHVCDLTPIWCQWSGCRSPEVCNFTPNSLYLEFWINLLIIDPTNLKRTCRHGYGAQRQRHSSREPCECSLIVAWTEGNQNSKVNFRKLNERIRGVRESRV